MTSSQPVAQPRPGEPVHRIYKPRGRVAHFSRLLRHAWVTLGLFLFPATTRECKDGYTCKIFLEYVSICSSNQTKQTEEIGIKYMSFSRTDFITLNKTTFSAATTASLQDTPHSHICRGQPIPGGGTHSAEWQELLNDVQIALILILLQHSKYHLAIGNGFYIN